MTYATHQKELWGGAAKTTNNRMELMAAIKAIEAIKPANHSHVELWTDSKYVLHGITEWIHGWKKRGWRKADKKPVLNADLWQELDALNEQHDIHWKWVKGHAGVYGNEKADELARRGIPS